MNIKKLRAEVMRAHKLAGDKARRIQKQTGANVVGSEFDPRRDASKVGRYNASQLRKYLSELDSFRDRGTQFVAGSGGAPIPKHLWARYENLQSLYNARADAAFSEISGVKLPGGSSIGQREEDLEPAKRSMLGRAANRPLGRVELSAKQIAEAGALPMLEKRLRGRLSEASTSRAIGVQRFHMAEMLSAIGEHDLVEKFSELNDRQFSALWNYTDFADFISTRYESVKKMSAHEQSKTGDDIRRDILDQYEWAKTI